MFADSFSEEEVFWYHFGFGNNDYRMHLLGFCFKT